MRWIEKPDSNPKARRLTPILQGAIAVLLPLSVFIPSRPSDATLPQQAKINEIVGNTSELLIRRSGRREPVQIGSILQKVRDSLITDPPNNARALLRFLSETGEDLNMYVQTNTHAESAIYHFPCQFQGGDILIGWELARNADRACEGGLTVQQGASSGATIPNAFPTIGSLKQLAQSRIRQIFYCTVEGNGDRSWLNLSAGDPCPGAREQCQAEGGGECEPITIGSWWTIDPQLQASMDCANSPSVTIDGTGETMEDQIEQLWPQTPGQSCRLQVYGAEDVVIIPASDDVVLAQGDDETLVQVRDTEAGLQVDVLEGAINLRSSDSEDLKLITTGQRYIHAESGGEITPFDRDTALNSVDMEVLCAFASYEENQLDISACRVISPTTLAQLDPEVNYARSEQIQFCNREQASGGQEGDWRSLQMTSNQGTIEIEYEMYNVPDRLQLIYEGREILDTGFISGVGNLSVPFRGNSGRLEVVLTGNTGISTTQWNYKLRCP